MFLICPDKFKGSLSAHEVAIAIARGLGDKEDIKIVPLADGGEGTAEILAKKYDAKRVAAEARDPLQRVINSWFYFSENTKTAIIQMSAASGHELLKEHELDPMNTSSVGTGDLILSALKLGAQNIKLCVGGSATNEGGAGMASSLGVKFFDKNQREIVPNGGNLIHLHSIDTSSITKVPQFEIIHDVTNPLLGSNGATMVYGPQKGAKADDLSTMEDGLAHYAQMLHFEDLNLVGLGAAGGIGLSAITLFGSILKPGFREVADSVGLEELVKKSSVVITGEGRLDSQSKEGKVVGEVEKLVIKHEKSLFIICGMHQDFDTDYPVLTIESIASSESDSIENAAKYVSDLATKVASHPSFFS